MDDDQRRDFERALTEVDGKTPQPEPEAILQTAVDAVYRRLREDGVTLQFTHVTGVDMDTHDLALYSFLRTEDPTVLEGLDVSSSVADDLQTGADALASGAVEDARAAFEDAIEVAETPDEHVSARVLTAWATSRAGEHDAALPLVTEALERDPATWPARVVGTVADHESPSLFRDGTIAVRPYFRIRADVPDGSDIGAAVRPRGDEEWVPLRGPLGCLRIPDSSIRPSLDIRLRLSGSLDDFPTLQAYYLAIGLVDEANDVPRNVLYQPLQGPETTDARETIQFERR
jgi:tetratricopeptide (TPR) repeat protein